MAAIHNGIRYFVQLQRAYRRAMGEPGTWGMERGGETLTPTINLWQLPEWTHLRDERRGVEVETDAAVAGQRSHVGLRNPTGSRMIVVVDRVEINSSTSRDVGLAVRAVGAVDTNNQAGPALDTRVGTASQLLRTQIVTLTQVGAAATIAWNRRVLANTVAEFNCGWVLSPGFELLALPAVDNEVIQANFIFRERQAVPGELE